MAEERRTEIEELGEFGLIHHLTDKILLANESSKLGIGDDAAVIQYDAGRQVVVTTDLLVEGIHFDLMYVPLQHLGYKAVIVNLSDIYAMNATPRQVTVSIAASNRFSVEALTELYSGIEYACKKYKVDLVGGDTTSSLKGLLIASQHSVKRMKMNSFTAVVQKKMTSSVLPVTLAAPIWDCNCWKGRSRCSWKTRR